MVTRDGSWNKLNLLPLYKTNFKALFGANEGLTYNPIVDITFIVTESGNCKCAVNAINDQSTIEIYWVTVKILVQAKVGETDRVTVLDTTYNVKFKKK